MTDGTFNMCERWCTTSIGGITIYRDERHMGKTTQSYNPWVFTTCTMLIVGMKKILLDFENFDFKVTTVTMDKNDSTMKSFYEHNPGDQFIYILSLFFSIKKL